MDVHEIRFARLLVVLLALGAGACATWQPATVPPRDAVESGRESIVRVTSVDGAVYEVSDPRSVNDSISVVAGGCIGIGERPNRRYLCATRGVVAYEDVSLLEVRRRPRGNVALAMQLAIGFTSLVVVGMVASGCVGLCGT